MTDQTATCNETMGQPELAVASDWFGATLAAWCVLASTLLLFVAF